MAYFRESGRKNWVRFDVNKTCFIDISRMIGVTREIFAEDFVRVLWEGFLIGFGGVNTSKSPPFRSNSRTQSTFPRGMNGKERKWPREVNVTTRSCLPDAKFLQILTDDAEVLTKNLNGHLAFCKSFIRG